MYEAARIEDPISHSQALAGFLVGAVIGVAIIAAATFATVTCGFGAALLVGLLAYGAGTGAVALGTWIGRMFRTTTGVIATGSRNVFTNSRNAALVELSEVECSRDGGDPAPVVAEGSTNVFINDKAAARIDDAITCGALIEDGSRNVFIGGGRHRYLDVADEIPDWLRRTVDVAFLIGGLAGGLARIATRMAGASLRTIMPCAAKYTAGYLAGEALGHFVVGPAIQRGWGALTGNPVELTTGRKVLMEAPDLDLVDRLPIRLERFYASDLTHEGLFGPGWACAWETRIETRDDRIILVDDQGREIELPHLEPGTTVFTPTEQLHFCRSPDGRYFLRDPYGGVRVFTAFDDVGTARLSHAEDSFGNFTVFERDEHGRLLALTSNTGQRIALRYTPALERVAAIERTHADFDRPAPAPLVSYRYHPDGRLAQVLDRRARARRHFSYDRGLMVSHRDALGFTCTYQWGHDFADGRPRVVAHQNSDGAHYHFRYAPASAESWAEDSFGHTAHWRYDERFNVVAFTDFDGAHYRTEYNAADLPVVLHLPGDRVARLEWDAFSRLARVTDPLGRDTRYAYHGDSLRRTVVALPDGSRWKARYDNLGQLRSATDPLGRTDRFDYHVSGLPSAHTDAAGHTRRFDYTPRGQLTTHTDCSGKTTRHTWNDDGLLVESSDALGRCTRFDYDALGRPQTLHLSDGDSESFEWDAAGHLIGHYRGGRQGVTRSPAFKNRWARDAAGRITRHTDPTGRTLDHAYDAHGRLLSLTNGNGAAYRFDYDAAGRLLRQVGVDGIETRHRYDAAGNRVETTTIGHRAERSGAASPEQVKTHRFEYDAAGRLIAAHSATAVHHYAYDAADRLLSARREPTELGRLLGIGEDALRFEYDAAGQLLAEHGADGAVRYGRDALGLPTRITLPHGQRLDALTYGSGHVHQRRFDDQVVSDFERDDLHRELWRSQGRIGTRFGYDPRGRLAWQQAGDDAQALGAPPTTPTAAAAGDGAPAQLWRRYAYDALGALAEQTDPLRGLTRFVSDSAGRLVEHRDATGSQRFVWDAAPAPHARSAGHLQDNRLRVWQDLRFDYDAFGRLVRKRKGSWREQAFEYDDEDRLVALHHSEHGRLHTLRFEYDALGRRRAKHAFHGANAGARANPTATPTASTRFVWTGLRLAQEIEPARVRTYLYAPDGAPTHAAAPYTPLARADQRLDDTGTLVAEPPRLHYFHTDAVGTPLELTSPDGELEWVGRIDPWGKTHPQSPTNGAARAHQPLRYPGQYEDAESGLHYNTFRFYDPDTGRFITQDPIGLAGGDNLYAYVPNPNGWIDPLGWCPTANVGGTGAGAARGLAGVPGRVGSRINLSNEGMEHVIARHLSGKANASQFSLSEAELRSVLSSRAAVSSPVVRSVESADGIRYVREFDAGRVIGADKFNGNQGTSVMTIMTDRFGNLVSTFPGLLK